MQMETKRLLISDKIDFEIKAINIQRRTLHNDQRINPRRRYNNYKYICTQHRSTAICKTNTNKYERGINSNTRTIGDFNTSFTPMYRSTKQKISEETQTIVCV